MSPPDTRLPGFYNLDPTARHTLLHDRFGLTDEDLTVLRDGGSLSLDRADKMVENCIGVFGLPIGLGLNFRVNGVDRLVPMVVEEPSVVAAVSNMAKVVRASGGFTGDADPPMMIGQVQVLDVPDPARAVRDLEAARARLIARANAVHPNMAARGAGAKDVEVRRIDAPWPMLVVHLIVDCADAMGANAINAMAEGVAPLIEELTGGRVRLRILSNLADRRRARAACRVLHADLEGNGWSGLEVARGIEEAWQFADACPYRAATHNKGVMNGIDAVAIATGNDWRAIEAGAHAYAARNGRYGSLTRWWNEGEWLHGEIELPMAVGTVGGSTNVHPTLKVLRKLLAVETAAELGVVIAAVGLAQNMAALRALATEGIQRGHMELHARSVALAAGAEGALVDQIADDLVRRGEIKLHVAEALLAALRTPERPE